ncbi:hypothetical protein Pmani_007499 [Petrolisthes manimaculis]|uniref:Uncharacterized protein n=1 Tax=Petrolisthes manimaculis TaxID=1843537 RepID=A0AAE1QAR3_9EUCA|nr:hypothetical protein Pmani_007499 [Petrolisthes manimaculis]
MSPQVRLHIMSQPVLSLQEYAELVDTLVEAQADHCRPTPTSAITSGTTWVHNSDCCATTTTSTNVNAIP